MNAAPLTLLTLRAALDGLRDRSANADDEASYLAGGIDVVILLLPDSAAHQMEGAASITAAAPKPEATAPVEPARPPAGTPAPRAISPLSVEAMHSNGIAQPAGPSVLLKRETTQGTADGPPTVARFTEPPTAPPRFVPTPPAIRGKARAVSSGSGAPISVWTAERDTMLDSRIDACTDRRALLAELNLLAGAPIASVDAMMTRARTLAQRPGTAQTAPKAEVTTTPDRLAMLDRLWPDASVTVATILREWNALPGKPLVRPQALYKIAGKAGLPTVRGTPVPPAALPRVAETAPPPAAAAPPPPPEPDHIAEAGEMAPAVAPPPPVAPAAADPAEPGHTATNPPEDPAPDTRPPYGKRAIPPLVTAAQDVKAEAFDAFARGLTVRDIAADFGEPAATVSMWHAEWRLKNRVSAS